MCRVHRASAAAFHSSCFSDDRFAKILTEFLAASFLSASSKENNGSPNRFATERMTRSLYSWYFFISLVANRMSSGAHGAKADFSFVRYSSAFALA